MHSTRKHPISALATIQDFISLVAAVHLSSRVDSPFQDRGGLMIVGPPGHLKTAMVKLLTSFSDALIMSDINVQGLTKIKERIAGNSIRTLVLPELLKLYERHPQVSSNVEGHLRALTGEGFASASFENVTISRLEAKATVIGAMTPSLREKRASDWDDSGFARRFLWGLVALENPDVLNNAVIEGKLIDIVTADAPRVGLGGVIPDHSTREERQQIALLCKYQPHPNTIQISVLIKAWAVMKWWARQQGKSEHKSWDSFVRASAAFGRTGVSLTIS